MKHGKIQIKKKTLANTIYIYIYIYMSRKMSHSSKLRPMLRYVNACLFIIISLNHQNLTFVLPIHVFSFYAYLYF